MTNKAYISKITHGSLEDGNGIRTVVFFSGCNLKCRWCHNPECIPLNSTLMYFENKCIHCGECIKNCPEVFYAVCGNLRIERSKCDSCGICTQRCLGEALSLSQSKMTTAEVFEEIIKDKTYYKYSSGGVTFSGGECLMQPDFLKELLQMCSNENINTCVETCLNVSWKIVADISSHVNSFFVDIKHMDPAKHQEYTGVTNERILSNIKNLFQIHEDITFRVPLIPGVNDDINSLKQTAEFVSSLKGKSIKRIELLKYNNLAESKYKSIGQDFVSFGNPQTDTVIAEKTAYLSQLYSDITFL